MRNLFVFNTKKPKAESEPPPGFYLPVYRPNASGLRKMVCPQAVLVFDPPTEAATSPRMIPNTSTITAIVNGGFTVIR